VKTLAARMAELKTPGTSVAVINGGTIEWARGYGVMEAGGSSPVTPRTLFQAASLGKPVAALRLVEQGKLALDEDVNARLTSWKVAGNEFTGLDVGLSAGPRSSRNRAIMPPT
jgi:CubicO group peptidase (beta-lactamase class C family)